VSLLGEIKKHTNEEIGSWVGDHIGKVAILELLYGGLDSIFIPGGCSEISMLILQFIWTCKGPQQPKQCQKRRIRLKELCVLVFENTTVKLQLSKLCY
jgi:hypothetical protein